MTNSVVCYATYLIFILVIFKWTIVLVSRRALITLLLDDEKRQTLAAEWGLDLQAGASFNAALRMNPRVEQLAQFTQVL